MTKAKEINLKKEIAPYEKTNLKASIRQLINTLVPLVLLWAAAYYSLSISFWLALPLGILTSGFVIRSFIIFHDCCHQSFFKSKLANEVVGTMMGVLSLVPYQQWKTTHSIHHASSGNLEKRGIGDIWILTVEEYTASSKWMQLVYRLYRNPITLFIIGPAYIFLVSYRFNRKVARRRERINTYITNISIVGLYALLCWAVGWQSFLMVQGPVFFFSGLAGVWLFYVQHQYEDSYFEHDDEWSYVKAAVEGSSYYKLPKVLQWLTGNIGFHHVHHLSPRVPNYLLEAAHNATPPLHNATTIDLRTSLNSLSFRLWDEESKKFIGFKGIKQAKSKQQERAHNDNEPKPLIRPSLEGK